MKVMYISRRFEENICATMHYKAIRAICKDENVITVDISLNHKCKIKNCMAYDSPGLKERIRQVFLCCPRWTSKKMMNEICSIINKEQVSTVYIDEGFLGQLVRNIKRKTNAKVITFSHDVAKVMYRERLAEQGIRFLPDFLALCRGEKLNVKNTDIALVLNERDRNLYIENYKISPDGYLPMGVADPDLNADDTPEFNFNREVKSIRYLLFVGTYYLPNIKGFRWFVNEVFRELSDNYHLVVVGRGLEKLKGQYDHPRIHIVGEVESLAPYYNNADIVVASVFGGGGMKQKTAEAFAYGKLFIGTVESIQGYEEELELRHNGYQVVFGSDNPRVLVQGIKCFETQNLYGFIPELHNAFCNKYSEKALINTLTQYIS